MRCGLLLNFSGAPFGFQSRFSLQEVGGGQWGTRGLLIHAVFLSSSSPLMIHGVGWGEDGQAYVKSIHLDDLAQSLQQS